MMIIANYGTVMNEYNTWPVYTVYLWSYWFHTYVQTHAYSHVHRHTQIIQYKYSLLMHCIKIKSRAKSLLNEQYVFVGGNISFLCMLSCISEEA